MHLFTSTMTVFTLTGVQIGTTIGIFYSTQMNTDGYLLQRLGGCHRLNGNLTTMRTLRPHMHPHVGACACADGCCNCFVALHVILYERHTHSDV